MKIYPREPDLTTIYGRIKEGTIDLQPDFQRDLVWNSAKKQSLIDTILREWHFPAIFLVVPTSGDTLDVLDGQQRLNAIYEFFEGRFPVNGLIEPFDSRLASLDKLYYADLPADVRSKFGRYSIRVYELTDYAQEEPYELFFRLNQGTVLTPAEKRNTLYGPVREQVRRIVEHMKDLGFGTEKIGFSNSRLSYEDVISRLLYSLEMRSISKKITDQALVELFRSTVGVSDRAYNQARLAVDVLAETIDRKVRLNKPTLLSWLLYYAYESPDRDLFYAFNDMRLGLRSNSDAGFRHFLLSLFQEKAATSVNDAVPVQVRLLIIYLFAVEMGLPLSSTRGRIASKIHSCLKHPDAQTEENLVQAMMETEWGSV